MKIKTIDIEDVKNVALIHKIAYTHEHFSSCFSQKMLAKYYTKILFFTNYNFIIYDEDKNTPLGFIIGGKEINQPIDEFIKENKLYLFFCLVKNPKFMIEKAKSIFYKIKGIKEKESSSKIILLSIAVDATRQKMGIGKLLISTFEEALRKDNFNRYSLSVRKANEKAIKFYELQGFDIEFETEGSIFYFKSI